MQWPLAELPKQIGPYEVVEAKGRGFYAATYLVRLPPLNTLRILKVAPVDTYSKFNKSWDEECKRHSHLVSQHQSHFVRIFTFGIETIEFRDGTSLPCHWAELDFVEGKPLSEFINSRGSSSQAAAQITLDLLEILRVLRANQIFHNDLHADNIIVAELDKADRRGTPFYRSIHQSCGN